IRASSRLMADHAYLLDDVDDPELRGMWLVWHCFVGYSTLNFDASVDYADRAIALGEECGSPRVVAYAHTQKSWALLSIGRSSEGVVAAEYALSLLPQLTD